MKIDVIGAGLAGCECAMQIADRGFEVNLIEMKPIKKSPAHHVDTFAELVCSNSLKSNDVNTAGGLLKEELRILGSHVIECADKTRVPAGGALAENALPFLFSLASFQPQRGSALMSPTHAILWPLDTKS